MRDVAIELRIARAIDLAHAAFAQLGDDLVGANSRAGRDGRHCAGTFRRSSSAKLNRNVTPGARSPGVEEAVITAIMRVPSAVTSNLGELDVGDRNGTGDHTRGCSTANTSPCAV